MQASQRRSFSRPRDGFTFCTAAIYYHGGLALLGVALFLPLAGAGADLGVPYLYWRESLRDQALVGFSVGLVFWHLGFVAYTLAAAKVGVIPHTPDDETEARRYVLFVLVPFLASLYVGCSLFYRLGVLGPPSSPPALGAPFGFGLLMSLGFTGLMLRMLRSSSCVGKELERWAQAVLRFNGWAMECVNRLLRKLWFTPGPDDHLDGLAPEYGRQRVFGLMTVFALSILITFLALSVATVAPRFRALPAAVPYCLALGLLGSGYGFARVLSRRLALPVLAVALGFAVWQWLDFPDGTMMPSNCEAASEPQRCAEAWSQRPSLTDSRPDPPATKLVDDDRALAAMIDDEQAPIVIITTSGGGIRSAGWTVAIFARLAHRDPEFFSRVRLITGASGGMVGAAHWVASEAAGEADPAELYCRATTNSLYALLGNLVLASPRRNRGEALERAWELASPPLGQPLSTLAEHEALAELPSLVFAPMLIEDGSQMLMSNLDLGWYAAGDRPLIVGDPPDCSIGEFWPAEGGCVNARQFFARVPAEAVKISTIARINASFPYVSPAVTLPFREHPRAVDAGYYDNYGIKLATAWIARHTHACPADATCLGDRPILLLELRALNPDQPIQPSPWVAILHELVSPIQGLFAARLHVATHRNANDVDVLRQILGDQLEHVVLQYGGEAALGWELTEREREDIWEKAGQENSWKRIDDWWRAHGREVRAGEPAKPSCE
ncbi:MAG: hypothetical protein R6X02_28120 [Enhygromyxa sp.]